MRPNDPSAPNSLSVTRPRRANTADRNSVWGGDSWGLKEHRIKLNPQ